MTAFPEVESIRYEGPNSTNPLAFRWYNADEMIEGVPMKEHLRFSVVYWHTFRGTGAIRLVRRRWNVLGMMVPIRWKTQNGGCELRLS